VSRRKESAFPRHIILLLHGCLRGKLYRQRLRWRRLQLLYAANNIILFLCRFVAVIKTNGRRAQLLYRRYWLGRSGGYLYSIYVLYIILNTLYNHVNIFYMILLLLLLGIIMSAVQAAKYRKRYQRYFGPSTFNYKRLFRSDLAKKLIIIVAHNTYYYNRDGSALSEM